MSVVHSFTGEGPFVEQGKLVRWHNSWSWGPNRTFPLDMGGFAVNSAVLGEGRFLPGRESPYAYNYAINFSVDEAHGFDNFC